MASLEALLSMAVFYNRVVAPIDATLNFTRDFRSMGIESIRIGRFLVDRSVQSNMRAAVHAFLELLSRFDIPSWIFDFDSAAKFLSNVDRHYFDGGASP
jgi:hypothetical protein